MNLIWIFIFIFYFIYPPINFHPNSNQDRILITRATTKDEASPIRTHFDHRFRSAPSAVVFVALLGHSPQVPSIQGRVVDCKAQATPGALDPHAGVLWKVRRAAHRAHNARQLADLVREGLLVRPQEVFLRLVPAAQLLQDVLLDLPHHVEVLWRVHERGFLLAEAAERVGNCAFHNLLGAAEAFAPDRAMPSLGSPAFSNDDDGLGRIGLVGDLEWPLPYGRAEVVKTPFQWLIRLLVLLWRVKHLCLWRRLFVVLPFFSPFFFSKKSFLFSV